MRILRILLACASVYPALAYGAQGSAASGAILRGEFVALISDYFQWVHWSEYNDYAKAVPRQFSDVPSTHRYARQIECALEERIIGPDADNDFHPDLPMTRQDAAAVLAAAFKIPASATDSLSASTSGGSVIQRAEAAGILKKIAAARVAPVQVMPKSGTTSYRRYVNMTCPTPGASIRYTYTDDRTEPADPLTSGKIYDPANGFLLFDNPNNSKTDTRYWTLKAVAVKDGMAASAVQTFVYFITRPQTASFEARLVHAPTTTSPAVWDIINPSDYNRPHVYYIEGSARGVVMDAGQYPVAKGNLKTFIDSLATKPYDVVLGHNNPDHVEQVGSFVAAGVRLFLTPQDKGSLAASRRTDFAAAADASLPIRDGDVLDLGNVRVTAYQAPGHSHGQVILQDKRNGWIFGSDMFGCNRPATADITNYSGAKMDLFLSLVQQLYSNLRKDGGRIEEVYNAHNEVPVGYAGIKNFEAAVQQLIDLGDSASVPSMRGMKQRTSVVGDMWRDKNWIALWVGGTWGGPVNYLTSANPSYKCNNTIDYNAAGGIRKYSVLSNVEIGGGDLVGVDVTWAPPSNGVANTLSNKFDPWTYAYDVRVPAGNTNVTITPTSMSRKVTWMKINDVVVKPGASQTVAVKDGSEIRVAILAPDGVTTSNYVFTVRNN